MTSFKHFLKEERMQRGRIETITPNEFKTRTIENPSWCKDLTEPLSVIGSYYFDEGGHRKVLTQYPFNRLPITHLSPYLYFDGAVDFSYCENLKVATGNFGRYTDFEGSGIEEIRDLRSTYFHNANQAVDFTGCENLKVAAGHYFGMVNFSRSGIEKIGDLTFDDGPPPVKSAWFFGCKNLKVLSGTFPGAIVVSQAGVEEIRDLTILNPDRAGVSLHIHGDIPIKKITNFKYTGTIRAEPELLNKMTRLMGQEKAGGPGQFDDLF